jgi:hypothetical protein
MPNTINLAICLYINHGLQKDNKKNYWIYNLPPTKWFNDLLFNINSRNVKNMLICANYDVPDNELRDQYQPSTIVIVSCIIW